VTPDQACKHPTWSMGRKISVDSATMMNKGLEVIEAHWLFGAPADRIEVVIHPQSVIHSMVSYVDGSVLAQLGNPDMRTPIAHALAYPERIASGVAQLDLTQIATLQFERPDFKRFPCLALAFDALRAGGTAPALLNAANEVAVQAFLDLKIGFRQIDRVIAHVMEALPHGAADSIEAVMAQDAAARAAAETHIATVAGWPNELPANRTGVRRLPRLPGHLSRAGALPGGALVRRQGAAFFGRHGQGGVVAPFRPGPDRMGRVRAAAGRLRQDARRARGRAGRAVPSPT
jgi:hypothetical protein